MPTGTILVSAYVVCERLSVKQVLAAVVEILVQNSQFTLFWDLVQFTPPLKLKFGQDLALWILTTPVYPPPLFENWNLDRTQHSEFWHQFTTPPLPRGYHHVEWLSCFTKIPESQLIDSSNYISCRCHLPNKYCTHWKSVWQMKRSSFPPTYVYYLLIPWPLCFQNQSTRNKSVETNTTKMLTPSVVILHWVVLSTVFWKSCPLLGICTVCYFCPHVRQTLIFYVKRDICFSVNVDNWDI